MKKLRINVIIFAVTIGIELIFRPYIIQHEIPERKQISIT